MKKLIAVLLFFGLVILPFAAKAAFVTYDYERYDASIGVGYGTVTFDDHVWNSTTPINLEKVYGDSSIIAKASTGTRHLQASAYVKYFDPNYQYANAASSMNLGFTPSSGTQGIISFDYTISISSTDPSAEYLWAGVKLRYSLRSSGQSIPVREIFYYTDGSDYDFNITGVFKSDVIDLIADGKYDLLVSIDYAYADYTVGPTDSNHAYASATISNIMVSQVPLPSAFVLFGSGLIGLIGFRRKFRKN